MRCAGTIVFLAVAQLLLLSSGNAAEWLMSEADGIQDAFIQESGKAQRNKSVAGDPLVIDGREFADGIGTHANSQAYLLLDGKAERLRGHVGISDAVRDMGSVFFSIMDVEKYETLWKSKLISGGDPAVEFDLPIVGLRQLVFLVSDSGDGNTNDHANWLEVAVEYSGEEPRLAGAVQTDNEPGVWKLSREELSHVQQAWGNPQRDRSLGNNVLSVGGIRYAEGIGTHAVSNIYVALDGGAVEITGLAGIDDETGGKGSASFLVTDAGTGEVLWDSKLRKGGEPPVAFRIPLKGVRTLLLRVSDGGDGNTDDHADWLDVKIRYEGDEPKLVAPKDVP